MTDITKKLHLKSELYWTKLMPWKTSTIVVRIRPNDLSVPFQRSPVHGPGVHIIIVWRQLRKKTNRLLKTCPHWQRWSLMWRRSLTVYIEVEGLSSFLSFFNYLVLDLSLFHKKEKEVDLYSAFIVVPHTQGTQIRITQCHLQIAPYVHLPRKRSPDGASPEWGCGHLIAPYYSFIYPERMKGYVGLVGWPIHNTAMAGLRSWGPCIKCKGGGGPCSIRSLPSLYPSLPLPLAVAASPLKQQVAALAFLP